MSAEDRNLSVRIGLKAFIVSAAIILALIVASGILGLVLPSGSYERTVADGRTLVVPGSYRETPRPDYPAWRWLTAPAEILFAPGNAALITIILFIVCVGGSIAVLEKAGVMEDLVRRLVSRFRTRKYALIAAFVFFFMAVSSFIGVYEGLVPMIVFIVPLAISLGWDSLTGLGMSLLPLAFGFASAVTNPFTVAVAQRIADLPLFSGSWLRIVFFFVVYGLVTAFVVRHAKRVERNPESSPSFAEDQRLRARLAAADAEAAADGGPGHARAIAWFASCIALALAAVFATARMPGLSDLAFPVMGLLFLVGGLGGGLLAGLRGKALAAAFGAGCANLAPGIVLILMAYSVKHVIVSAGIMDTILFYAAEAISGSTPMAAAFLVYATTLAMNFFIGSASAKAFLMMPLLAPLADLVGITRQTAVLAFDFGDGFSNMIFPTNALLLIALSFTVVGYPKWLRWTAPLQVAILAVTSLFLAFAVLIRFGPF
jgi:uncharacterized ion transporter superfamily protein YfcC